MDILARFVARVEFRIVRLAGRLLGLEVVVRYLRNPNPLCTIHILRAFGATVGEKSTFKGRIWIDNAYQDENSAGDFTHLVVGKNCYIGDGVFFDLANRIVINDNSVISGNSSFLTHSDCNRSPILNALMARKCAPIEVGQGAWIGHGATILAGVFVEKNSVVAAGAVLTRDTQALSVYAGIPGRYVRTLHGAARDDHDFVRSAGID